MKLLVTGGAGYIGSHVVRAAEAAGHSCVVVDNLSTGLTKRISCPVVELDLASKDAVAQLVRLMKAEQFDSVIHLAARKQVGESVEKPEEYFLENLGGLGNLLLAMREVGLKSLVFSSSAATYGMPDVDKVTEDYPGVPINPYGQTKLIGEQMVQNAKVWGLKGVNLRYFNVAGAGASDLADTAALNLIPIAINAIKAGKAPIVFGTDYPTPDGSCIRDYLHVEDLAMAHLAAVKYLVGEGQKYNTFNVGTGVGASVIEVLSALKVASGIDFEIALGERRAGDPPRLVADVSRIDNEFGFRTKHDLAAIVQSAWDAS
ncbi:MAG: UDP-glucose 4-epimerase GalE [Actinomycetota bacterium]|jgi:UDP-glucose 4-epimerase